MHYKMCSDPSKGAGSKNERAIKMTDGNGNGAPTKVDISYIKSSQFRVVSAHGAYGGFGPNGYFALTVFVKDPAIPQEVYFIAVQPFD